MRKTTVVYKSVNFGPTNPGLPNLPSKFYTAEKIKTISRILLKLNNSSPQNIHFINQTLETILWNFASANLYTTPCVSTYLSAGQVGTCLPPLQKSQFYENIWVLYMFCLAET